MSLLKQMWRQKLFRPIGIALLVLAGAVVGLSLHLLVGRRSVGEDARQAHSGPAPAVVTPASPVPAHISGDTAGRGELPGITRASSILWQTLGWSVERRPIRAAVIGSGPDVTLLVAGVHGDEPEGAYLVRMLIDTLQKDADRVAGKKIVLVPEANPDGLVMKTRVNAHKVDINRNFPTRDWSSKAPAGRYNPGPHPASEPETRALLRLIDRFQPAKIIAIHSPLHQINFDGPAEMLAREIALHNGYPVSSFIGYPTPGSLGTYAGKERGIPTITLELPPISRERAWAENRDGLLAAVDFPVKTQWPRQRILRYRVVVEENLTISQKDFTADLHRILSDFRGWRVSGRIAFRVEENAPPHFTVILANPRSLDEWCAPLRTLGRWNCYILGRVVINAERWLTGAFLFDSLDDYRAYVINHEVGHALGLVHRDCPGPGRRAPVMMQQLKGLNGCQPNPWPLLEEIARVPWR